MFPMVSELFGYAVAESLSCGTPVLCYDSGGPAEQVEDGRSGWKVRTPEEFVSTAVRLVRDGYADEFRSASLRAATRFALPTVAQGFLEHLARAASSPR